MENNILIRFWVSRPMRDFHVTLGVAAVAAHVIGNLSKNPALPDRKSTRLNSSHTS